MSKFTTGVSKTKLKLRKKMISTFPNRNRLISTPRLSHCCVYTWCLSRDNLSRALTIPNLGVGFELRCFQLLSMPDIATRRAPGGTADTPEVSSTRSSRTRVKSPQESTPAVDRRPTCLTLMLLQLLRGSDYIITYFKKLRWFTFSLYGCLCSR